MARDALLSGLHPSAGCSPRERQEPLAWEDAGSWRLLQGRSLDEGTAYGSLSSRERGNTDQAWQERRPVITSGPAFPAAVRRQQPRHVGGGELQLVARRRTAAGGQPARSSGTQPSHGSVQNEATYPATRRLSMSQRGEDTSVIGG